MKKRKPRNYAAAMLSETMSGEMAIFINACEIGGSIVRISPSMARKMGQRLIEMADWMERNK